MVTCCSVLETTSLYCTSTETQPIGHEIDVGWRVIAPILPIMALQKQLILKRPRFGGKFSSPPALKARCIDFRRSIFFGWLLCSSRSEGRKPRVEYWFTPSVKRYTGATRIPLIFRSGRGRPAGRKNVCSISLYSPYILPQFDAIRDLTAPTAASQWLGKSSNYRVSYFASEWSCPATMRKVPR